jgi:protein gp37
MNKTKIEWADRTWNPVTGCLHGCPYCYARNMVRRFGSPDNDVGIYELDRPGHDYADNGEGWIQNYPHGFRPTLHRYRLNEPQWIKKPQNIFVCSMADLFGTWVPDEWIEQVLDACCRATQHRYLFLTKNPERYYSADEYIESEKSALKEGDVLFAYFGASVTSEKQLLRARESQATWLSIEPLLEDITGAFEDCSVDFHSYDGSEFPHWSWIVLGAESGNRKDRVIPKREWIEGIVEDCRITGTPVFMKNSLATIWSEPLIREYPWSGLSA